MFRSLTAMLVTVVVVTQVAIFTTTVWLHRTLSHKAVTVRPGVTMTFRLITWFTTGLRPRQWVAVHRLHHAHSDEEGDPHSPRLLSLNKVQWGNAYLYKKALRNKELVNKYAKDLPPDKWDRMFLDHAVLGLGLGILALCGLFGWKLGLIGSGIHAVSYLVLSGAVNAVGHMKGKRPEQSTFAGNCQWLAWLTAGEGLHNNHHAMPTAAKFSFRPGEVDIGWVLVRTLERFGWATVRHQPEMLRARAKQAA